jgi:hypothetical protein
MVSREWKKVLVAGIAGGILLFIAQFAFSILANLVAPFDIFAIGGMRRPTDPVMLLFYAYPFVLSFASAVVFDLVKDALPRSCCGGAGLAFGLILILLVTVPGMFVIFSSMDYPGASTSRTSSPGSSVTPPWACIMPGSGEDERVPPSRPFFMPWLP